jgi:Immunity protein 52
VEWKHALTAVLTVRCGLSVEGGYVGNAVVLKPPENEADGRDVYRLEIARAIILGMVECWQPTWATWSSIDLYDKQGDDRLPVVVGWATYVAKPYGVDVSALPDGTSCTALDSGTLVIAGDPGSRPSKRTLRAIRRSIKP